MEAPAKCVRNIRHRVSIAFNRFLGAACFNRGAFQSGKSFLTRRLFNSSGIRCKINVFDAAIRSIIRIQNGLRGFQIRLDGTGDTDFLGVHGNLADTQIRRGVRQHLRRSIRSGQCAKLAACRP